LELDITSIKERLDSIESLLAKQTSLGPLKASVNAGGHTTRIMDNTIRDERLLQRKSIYDTNDMPDTPDFPLMVIRNKAFMDLIGLKQTLATQLAALERSAPKDIELSSDGYVQFRQHETLEFV